MSNDDNLENSGSDSSKTDTGLPLSRRGMLAATGLAGLGLAGSNAVSAQDGDSDVDGAANSRFAVKEHDHSGAYGAASQLGAEMPVESITVEELTSSTHNDVVYASEFDTVNEAVNTALAQTDGAVKVILPRGTTRYTDHITVQNRTVVIEGQGMNESTLEADGAHRFLSHYTDSDEERHSLALKGFTLDMMQEPGAGRAVVMDGGHTLAIKDIRAQEINIRERNRSHGLIRAVNLERMEAMNNEIRFDTVTNRAGAGPRDKIRVVSSPQPVKQFIASGNRLVGERITFDDRPEKNFFNGFRVTVAEGGMAVVRDNLIEQWDQYATFISGRSGASIFIVNNSLPDAGTADIIRASARGHNANIVIDGNTVEKGDEFDGDRGIVVPGGGNGACQITNNYLEGVTSPIEVGRGGRNVRITGNTIRNCGQPGGGTTDAILLRDSIGGIGPFTMRNAHVANNILDNTESEREIPILVRLDGGELSGFFVIENNIVDGLTSDSMEDAVSAYLGDDAEVIVRNNLLNSIEGEGGEVPDWELKGTVPRESISIDGSGSEVRETEPHASLGDEIIHRPQEVSETLHGADFWFRYDEDYLYLVGIVDDEEHYQVNTGGSFYNQDCVQLMVSEGPPGAATQFDEIDLALTPEGPRVFRRTFPSGPTSLLKDGAELDIVRDEESGETVYELALEWGGPIQAEFNNAGIYSFDLAGVDHDGNERREGLWQWGEQNEIFGSKENLELKAFELI